jgi:hypothetical protein
VSELNEEQQILDDLEGTADQWRQDLERRGEQRQLAIFPSQSPNCTSTEPSALFFAVALLSE